MANKSNQNNRKRSSRSKRKNKKVNLAIAATIGITCIGMFVFNKTFNDKSDKAEETNGNQVVTQAVTGSPTGGVSPTDKPVTVPTKVPVTVTPEPTKKVEEVTPTPKISESKATELVKDAVNDNKYEVNLYNDTIIIDDDEYFEFHILQDGKITGPAILVAKEDGALFYYDESGVVTPFTKFPLDKVESVEESDNSDGLITDEEAIKKAKALSKDELGLSKELKDYTIEVDSWTTVVNGESSYCLNVFDETSNGKQLVGVFYVSEDGGHVYKLNEETQEFIQISK